MFLSASGLRNAEGNMRVVYLSRKLAKLAGVTLAIARFLSSKVSFDRVQILTPDFSGRRPPPVVGNF